MRTYRTQVITYDFPLITHINDVLPHISGKDEFRVMEKDWYTAINYAVAFEDTFQWNDADPVGSAVRRECRGLIFNTETGNLISHPYHKFFNAGEKEETQLNKINLYEPHIVLEKLDGSMIRPIPTPEGFRLGTKAGITDVAMNAEVFVADKPHYATFINKCIQKGTTPIFEWVSRKNRIVVDYPEDNLILTGLRYNDTGKYVDYQIMSDYATSWNIPVVKAVDGLAVQNIDLFVKQVREWDDGEEGVVVRFDSGHMCKVKSADYVLRHKSKDSISQEKNVLQTILNDSVDDLVPLLTPEDGERIQRFQGAFWAALEDVGTEIHDLYKQIDRGQDQKEFAMMAVPSVLPQYQNFMFKLRKGVPVRDLLIEQISKSLGSQPKIDAARWMFGGIDWNYLDTKEP
jgi:RNA ligase